MSSTLLLGPQVEGSSFLLIACVEYMFVDEVGDYGLCTVSINGTYYDLPVKYSCGDPAYCVVCYLVACCFMQFDAYVWVLIACPRIVYPSFIMFSGGRIVARFVSFVF